MNQRVSVLETNAGRGLMPQASSTCMRVLKHVSGFRKGVPCDLLVHNIGRIHGCLHLPFSTANLFTIHVDTLTAFVTSHMSTLNFTLS